MNTYNEFKQAIQLAIEAVMQSNANEAMKALALEVLATDLADLETIYN